MGISSRVCASREAQSRLGSVDADRRNRAVEFARDSSLEEAEFEPSVPRKTPAVVVMSGLVAPPSPLRQAEPTQAPSLETLVVSRRTDGSIRLVPAVSQTNTEGYGVG